MTRLLVDPVFRLFLLGNIFMDRFIGFRVGIQYRVFLVKVVFVVRRLQFPFFFESRQRQLLLSNRPFRRSCRSLFRTIDRGCQSFVLFICSSRTARGVTGIQLVCRTRFTTGVTRIQLVCRIRFARSANRGLLVDRVYACIIFTQIFQNFTLRYGDSNYDNCSYLVEFE